MRPAALLVTVLSSMDSAVAATNAATGAGFPIEGLAAWLRRLLLLTPAALFLLGMVLPMLCCVVLGLRLFRQRRAYLRRFDEVGIGVWQWRTGPIPWMRTSRVSARWSQMTGENPGRKREAAADTLARLERAMHPMDRDGFRASCGVLLSPDGLDEARETFRLRAKDSAQWHWHALRTQVLERNRQGLAQRLFSTLSDVSQEQTAEERQRISAGLFRHLHDGVLVTDPSLHILDANPAYCRMMGIDRQRLLGSRARPLLPQTLEDNGYDPAQLLQLLDAGDSWEGLLHTEREDGPPCSLQVTIAPVNEPDGSLRYRVVTVSDQTLVLRQRRQLEQQARFDELTGLARHGEFVSLLQAAIGASEREDVRLAICRVDLDHFKRINIQHGREVADAVLRQAAQRLQGALRHGPQWGDALGRLDGDEFALLLRISDADEAQRALDRLLNVLRAPYRLLLPGQDLVLEITASIGATLFPQDRSDAETLLRHAGYTLYRVKHSGRNSFRFFDSAKRLRDEASLIELARIQQALDNDELRLYFQPKIDMQSGQVLGMEALLRWQHPERGLLPPAEFLPNIEQTGLAVQVGDWVIDHALKQIALWLDDGLNLNVAVNVTARQLQMPDFTQRLQELIKRHHRPVAPYLSLEVLESAALADIQATHDLILRCRAFGVRFALDDFGTGYSTLTYLKKLPVDALKIDRSFVQHMLTDAQDMALVEGVIGLARHFGAELIAEGVESAAHARALLRLGCQQGQGNGIAKAMPAAEVPAWVRGFARSPWLMQLAQSGNAGLRNQGLA